MASELLFGPKWKYTFPPYGHRDGFKPNTLDDYGDGGAFPEIDIKQYPLNMGMKTLSSFSKNFLNKISSKTSKTITKTVDKNNEINYNALLGKKDAEITEAPTKLRASASVMRIEGASKDLTLLPNSITKIPSKEIIPRPDIREVKATTEKTKSVLDALINKKSDSLILGSNKKVSSNTGRIYVEYTPSVQTYNLGESGFVQKPEKRILEIQDAPQDPMEPARFKIKKGSGPKRERSPPAPVLHAPAKSITTKERKEWAIPPCVSSWKNNKGYTVQLDKRLAVDGRHLANQQRNKINDGFFKLADALGAADKHAREEVKLRTEISKRAMDKEQRVREEDLRKMAVDARQLRGKITK